MPLATHRAPGNEIVNRVVGYRAHSQMARIATALIVASMPHKQIRRDRAAGGFIREPMGGLALKPTVALGSRVPLPWPAFVRASNVNLGPELR